MAPPSETRRNRGSVLSLSSADGRGGQHPPGPDQKHAGFRRDPGGESGRPVGLGGVVAQWEWGCGWGELPAGGAPPGRKPEHPRPADSSSVTSQSLLFWAIRSGLAQPGQGCEQVGPVLLQAQGPWAAHSVTVTRQSPAAQVVPLAAFLSIILNNTVGVGSPGGSPGTPGG